MKNISIIYLITLLAFAGCNMPTDWSDPTNSIPPGSVTNVEVENTNGGAILTFVQPEDEDLLGVKAYYKYIEGGEVRTKFTSAYSDTIMIEGFPDVKTRTVKLVAIDKSMNESVPVEINITPLTPPVQLIRNTLTISETFGGVYAKWINEFNTNVVVTLFVEDSVNNELEIYEAYYSSSTEGSYAFRGFKNVERRFVLEIRDRWDNYSTLLDTVLTPLFEEEIYGRNRETQDYEWHRYGIDVDAGTAKWWGDNLAQRPDGQHPFKEMWDGITWSNDSWAHTGNDSNILNDYLEDDQYDENYTVEPLYFTILMDKPASFSRHKYWMRARNPVFSAQCWEHYRIWATNDPKPIADFASTTESLKYWTAWPEIGGTDAWKNDWVMVADCKVELPSGETDPNKLTEEDRAFVIAGFDFDCDPQYANKQFKYVRFEIIKSFGGGVQIQTAEIKFWGKYAK
ncbi:MAG: DUF5126 domain-containing protein [Cyclobacteriaceae bacterium]|nr:DUF5126 domain-containing protein [Cyclobacteriaceae bacterium]